MRDPELIEAGLERLRAKRAIEEEQEAKKPESIFGPWPPAIRSAIAAWPHAPVISAALRDARADSPQLYQDDWPIVARSLTDLEVSRLLGDERKGWLTHHAVRVAIAQSMAKKAKKRGERVDRDEILRGLLDFRDQAQDRLIEEQERARVLAWRLLPWWKKAWRLASGWVRERLGGRDEGEEAGSLRGRSVRGDGEQRAGEGEAPAAEPRGEGAAEEGRPEAVA